MGQATWGFPTVKRRGRSFGSGTPAWSQYPSVSIRSSCLQQLNAISVRDAILESSGHRSGREPLSHSARNRKSHGNRILKRLGIVWQRSGQGKEGLRLVRETTVEGARRRSGLGCIAIARETPGFIQAVKDESSRGEEMFMKAQACPPQF